MFHHCLYSTYYRSIPTSNKVLQKFSPLAISVISHCNNIHVASKTTITNNVGRTLLHVIYQDCHKKEMTTPLNVMWRTYKLNEGCWRPETCFCVVDGSPTYLVCLKLFISFHSFVLTQLKVEQEGIL